LRAVGTDDVDVQRQQCATELGHTVAAGSLLAVHPGQLLSALQGAALVANYVLKNPFASLGIYFLAILSTLYLNYIWEVDRLIRNSYAERLKRLDFKVGLEREEREALDG
jgi:hypothetical protein